MRTRPDGSRLQELREVTAIVDALKCAFKEAELERDGLISGLVNDGFGGQSLAIAAGMTKGWPSKIVDLHPPRLARWRAQHPDRLQVLIDARTLLNQMIRRAREAGDGS